MKIDEAVRNLSEGKTVNSANAQATLKPFEKEGEKRVTVTRIKRDGAEDVMDLTLTRLQQVYSQHDFALGQFKTRAASPAEVKPAGPDVTK